MIFHIRIFQMDTYTSLEAAFRNLPHTFLPCCQKYPTSEVQFRFFFFFLGVQEVRQYNGGTERPQNYTIFPWTRSRHQPGKDFLCTLGSYQQFRVYFVGETMSYRALNGHGCNTVLNVHATMEDKVMTQRTVAGVCIIRKSVSIF